MNRTPRLSTTVHYALYYGLARHLPWSIQPGGRIYKRLRAWSCRHLLEASGPGLNVESGAWFGSGAGIRIGSRSGIGLQCLVMGPCTIGDDVMMGPRCVIMSTNHNSDDLSTPMDQQGLSAPRPVHIQDDVWLGAHVLLLPGVVVGRGSIVAAGSVVTKDVPPYAVVAGNPARVLRLRGEESGSAGSGVGRTA